MSRERKEDGRVILHNQTAASLVLLVVHLVSIALSLLRVSVCSALGLAVCLLIETTNLAHKVVE